MADDIGEALDFVVGLAKIGGAFVDGGFQIEVVVAQPRFGGVRARAEPRTRKMEMPANATTRPEPATVTIEASRWRAVRGRGAQREQPVFLRVHGSGNVVNTGYRIAGTGLPEHRDTAGDVAAGHKSDGLGKFLQPSLDRREAAACCFRPERDCRW